MLIYAEGNNVDCLSVYLDVAEASTLPYGWNRYTKFKLTLVDQFDTNKSITKGIFSTDHISPNSNFYLMGLPFTQGKVW